MVKFIVMITMDRVNLFAIFLNLLYLIIMLKKVGRYVNKGVIKLGAKTIALYLIFHLFFKFSFTVIYRAIFSRAIFNPIVWTMTSRHIYYTGVELIKPMTFAAILLGMAIVGGLGKLLVGFGATESIGSMLTVTIVRLAAPIIVGLLLIFRTSTSVFLDVSLMSMNGEIRYLKSMDINPYDTVYLPRIFSSTLSMFILSTYFILISFIGGFTLLSFRLNMAFSVVLRQILSSLELSDLFSFIFKITLTGFIITAIPIYTALDPKHSELDILKSVHKTMIRIFFAFVGIIVVGEIYI